MQLHYFPRSHWSRVIHLVLREKGIEAERHLVDITKNANYEPAYLDINPRGVVPTIVHDGQVVCNSPVIARFLDTLPGPTTWPDDPIVNRWADVLEDFPLMHLSYRIWVLGLKGERSAKILQDKIDRSDAYALRYPDKAHLYEHKHAFFKRFVADLTDQSSRDRIEGECRATLDELAEVVADREWLGGNVWTCADAIAASILYRLVDLPLLDEFNVEGHPLQAYLARLQARPAYQWVWHQDPNLD
jgi:glutathione S-transferase